MRIHIKVAGKWHLTIQNKDATFKIYMVRDDPKLLGDSGEVPIYAWNGWRFDSRYEGFSLLDEKKTR